MNHRNRSIESIEMFVVILLALFFNGVTNVCITEEEINYYINLIENGTNEAMAFVPSSSAEEYRVRYPGKPERKSDTQIPFSSVVPLFFSGVSRTHWLCYFILPLSSCSPSFFLLCWDPFQRSFRSFIHFLKLTIPYPVRSNSHAHQFSQRIHPHCV